MDIQKVGLDELRQLIDTLDYDMSDLADIEILAACTGTCSTCNGTCQKCNSGSSNGNSLYMHWSDLKPVNDFQ